MSRAFVTAILLFTGSLAIADKPDPVVEAARARQELVKTLVVEYRQVSRLTLKATATRPLSQLATTTANRIVLDGNKVRVEDNSPSMSTLNGFSQVCLIQVFDGSKSLTLMPAGIPPDTTPIAIRHEKSAKAEANMPEVVYLFARGLDPKFRMFQIDKLKPTGHTQLIDGVECLEYQLLKMDSIKHYWFDPGMGYNVRRIESERNGRIQDRTTVTYRKDPIFGWSLTGWRRDDLNPDGSPKYVRECEVTRLDINGPVDPGEFQLKFKPGTSVSDREAKKDYRVEADGSLHEYTIAERYGNAPQPSVRQWIARNPWLLVLAASVLLLCLLPILIRRRRRAVPSAPEWDLSQPGDAD